MPQLDIVTFPAQVFSLFIVFFFYYIIVSKNILPTISNLIGTRSFFLESSRNKSLVFTNESSSFKERKVESFNNIVFSSEKSFVDLSNSLDKQRAGLFNQVVSDEKSVNSNWLSKISS